MLYFFKLDRQTDKETESNPLTCILPLCISLPHLIVDHVVPLLLPAHAPPPSLIIPVCEYIPATALPLPPTLALPLLPSSLLVLLLLLLFASCFILPFVCSSFLLFWNFLGFYAAFHFVHACGIFFAFVCVRACICVCACVFVRVLSLCHSLWLNVHWTQLVSVFYLLMLPSSFMCEMMLRKQRR